jgi:hypothetical protein
MGVSHDRTTLGPPDGPGMPCDQPYPKGTDRGKCWGQGVLLQTPSQGRGGILLFGTEFFSLFGGETPWE